MIASRQWVINLLNKVIHTVITTKTDDSLAELKFGKDSDGNYGYYKDGADTITPFKSSSFDGYFDSDVVPLKQSVKFTWNDSTKQITIIIGRIEDTISDTQCTCLVDTLDIVASESVYPTSTTDGTVLLHIDRSGFNNTYYYDASDIVEDMLYISIFVGSVVKSNSTFNKVFSLKSVTNQFNYLYLTHTYNNDSNSYTYKATDDGYYVALNGVYYYYADHTFATSTASNTSTGTELFSKTVSYTTYNSYYIIAKEYYLTSGQTITMSCNSNVSGYGTNFISVVKLTSDDENANLNISDCEFTFGRSSLSFSGYGGIEPFLAYAITAQGGASSTLTLSGTNVTQIFNKTYTNNMTTAIASATYSSDNEVTVKASHSTEGLFIVKFACY